MSVSFKLETRKYLSPKGGSYFGNENPSDIADKISLALWGIKESETQPVNEWLKELRSRPDANTQEIQDAIEVINEWLDDETEQSER
ncbi:hypothetical protein FAI40_04185 [Acetobacteraceae bacterium]|nr:hypothetical protein FAI40_04185 [Acetobacteraceae bacterium]